jgi:hypothetical protein
VDTEFFTGTKTGEFAMVDVKSTCGKRHVRNEWSDLWQYWTSHVNQKIEGRFIHCSSCISNIETMMILNDVRVDTKHAKTRESKTTCYFLRKMSN